MVQEGVVLPIQYHELNSGLMGVYRGCWDIGIGVKKEGIKVMRKEKNETKPLYLARLNVLEPKEVQNIGF